jgi:uncharacterized protein
MRPVAAFERVILLDVLRGFALFGILMVNIQQIFRPQEAAQLTAASSAPDQAVCFLIDLLFEGKFFPIYSFLFGLGAYVITRRVAESGGDVRRFFHLRLGVLAAFGLAHGILLWTGDILFSYAVAGFFLKPQSTPQGLLKRSVLLLLIVPLLAIVIAVLAGGRVEFDAEEVRDLEWKIQAYSQGDFFAVTRQRLIEFGTNCAGLLAFAPSLLGLFLFGYRAGLTGLLFDRPLLGRCLTWTLPVGLGVSGIAAWLGLTSAYQPVQVGTWRWAIQDVAGWIGGLLLALAYVCLVSLLWPRLRLLAPAGRMALTNYLTQSLLLTTLAYGYGFGLYLKLGQATLAAIALTLYAAQLGFSHWWLRHHEQGPLEKLWRWASRPPENAIL